MSQKQPQKKKEILVHPNRRKEEQTLLILAVAVYVIIPVIIYAIEENSIISEMLHILTSQILITLLLAITHIFLTKIWHGKWRIVAIGLLSTYFLGISFIEIYWLQTGGPPDIMFILDSGSEAIETARKILGPKIWLVLGALFTAFILSWRINEKILIAIENNIRIKKRYLAGAAVLVGIMAFMPNSYIFVASETKAMVTTLQNREHSMQMFPNNNNLSTESNESIFILQLEASNAIALQGGFEIGGESYNKNMIPNISKISEDGVFMPYFWGNTMQTNRGLETILCGQVANIGESFSYKSKEIPYKCLPSLLKESGYKTLYFMAYPNADFFDMENFVRTIGFEEFHYSNIMKKTDKVRNWGYDDCTYYQRVFEYLQKNYNQKEKLFVYIEVSMHHSPWEQMEDYQYLHKYKPAKNQTEKHLNSALQQDYCVKTFYQKYKEYKTKNTHLLITSDHSYPVGIQTNGNPLVNSGIYNENFLTHMSYIPSSNRKKEFIIGAQIQQIFSQTDIIPTVFEILNKETYQNSIVPALRGERLTNYEDCHILTQPYGGGQLAVVKGNDKYVYYVNNKQVVHYNIKKDWWEKKGLIKQKNMELNQFVSKTFCNKHKTETE